MPLCGLPRQEVAWEVTFRFSLQRSPVGVRTRGGVYLLSLVAVTHVVSEHVINASLPLSRFITLCEHP